MFILWCIEGCSYLFECYIVCPICLEKPINSVKMPCCQQILCKVCNDWTFQASPYCPVCRKRQQVVAGNHPSDATMSHSEKYGMCPVFAGYCCCDCHKSSHFLVDIVLWNLLLLHVFCTVDLFTKIFACLSSCKMLDIIYCTFALGKKFFILYIL